MDRIGGKIIVQVKWLKDSKDTVYHFAFVPTKTRPDFPEVGKTYWVLDKQGNWRKNLLIVGIIFFASSYRYQGVDKLGNPKVYDIRKRLMVWTDVVSDKASVQPLEDMPKEGVIRWQ